MKKLNIVSIIAILFILNIHIPISIIYFGKSLGSLKLMLTSVDEFKTSVSLLGQVISYSAFSMLCTAVYVYIGVYLHVREFKFTTNALYKLFMFYRCIPKQSQNLLFRYYLGDNFIFFTAILAGFVYQIVMVKNITEKHVEVQETIDNIREYKSGLKEIYQYIISYALLGEIIGWFLYLCIELYDNMIIYKYEVTSLTETQKLFTYFSQVIIVITFFILESTNYKEKVKDIMRAILS